MPAAAANVYLPEPVTITEVARELDDVFTWTLSPRAPFAFRPGQFNMLYAHGVGEVPISISGDPAAPGELVHTIRSVGPVTRALERMRAGDTAFVRGPYGTSWPVEEIRGQDLLLVAGGLGLAPLRPAIYDILQHRAEYGRVHIIFGARSPAHLLYRDEVERWRGRFDVELDATVDSAGRDWRGPVGVVTPLVAAAPIDTDGTVALVCGPEIMMRFVLRELETRGLPASQIYLSLERSMKCGVGLCGHCQLAGNFVCKDGPVFRADRVLPLLYVREL
jgi:NAD(P)H-flavin reductase